MSIYSCSIRSHQNVGTAQDPISDAWIHSMGRTPARGCSLAISKKGLRDARTWMNLENTKEARPWEDIQCTVTLPEISRRGRSIETESSWMLPGAEERRNSGEVQHNEYGVSFGGSCKCFGLKQKQELYNTVNALKSAGLYTKMIHFMLYEFYLNTKREKNNSPSLGKHRSQRERVCD